jgi:membrane protein required for colicin V production
VNWADYTIIGIVVVSAGFGMMRGFVKEAFSLAGWVLAFWVALSFSDALVRTFMGAWGIAPTLKIVVSFTLLFAVTMALSTLVNYLVGQVVDKAGLSGTDRAVGVLFGVARGGIIVAVLVLMLGMTSWGQTAWWREAVTIRPIAQFAVWMRDTVGTEWGGKSASG